MLKRCDVKQFEEKNVAPAMIFDVYIFIRGANCSSLPEKYVVLPEKYVAGLVTLPEKYVVLPEKYVAGLVSLPEKYVVLPEKYVAGLVTLPEKCCFVREIRCRYRLSK